MWIILKWPKVAEFVLLEDQYQYVKWHISLVQIYFYSVLFILHLFHKSPPKIFKLNSTEVILIYRKVNFQSYIMDYNVVSDK